MTKKGRARVLSTLTGGPADGLLSYGDEILAVDGVECSSFAHPTLIRDALLGNEVALLLALALRTHAVL